MEQENGKPGAVATGSLGTVSARWQDGSHDPNYDTAPQRFQRDELERARCALACIDPHDNGTWQRVGMGLKAEFGDAAWFMFDEWSRPAENYDAQENRSRWRSFKPDGGITIATLFAKAHEAGWRDDRSFRLPEAGELAARARARAEAGAAQKWKQDIARAGAAKKASAIWSAARPVDASHPYCHRKGITPTDTLREIDAAKAATVLGYCPSAGPEKLRDRCLVAPMKIDGDLVSVQLIDGSGGKHFLAGGAVGGAYWAAQSLPDGDGAGQKLLIGEGIATVLSSRAAMDGACGIAAMMNSNIPAIARVMREKYPLADIVVLADTNKNTGDPDGYAVRAARAIGGMLAVPQFADGPAAERKDFNDMVRLHGTDAVSSAFELGQAPSCGLTAPVATSWRHPQPLVAKIEPELYPLEALPNGIREAVEEVANYMRAPVPLVASCALSALSLVCQHQIDVRRDQRLCGPSALFFLTIAESGERKTTVDGMFMSPLRDWQRRRAEELTPDVNAHQAAHAAWTAECEGVRAAIKEAAKKDKPSDHLKGRLTRLQQIEPCAPRVPRLFLSDETPESMAWRLHSEWPSAGLVSSEAGVVFGGHAMGQDKVLGYLALLNILWDGGEHSVGRKTSPSFTVRGARLTCGLQLQEATLRDFMDRAGLLARGTGFFARFLISWPQSTQGIRLYREPGFMPDLDVFQARLARLLDLPVPIQDDGTLRPITLLLDADAKKSFIAYHDAIEKALGEGGELRDVRDVASKAAENAARLAALFQSYAADPKEYGEVTSDSFNRAGQIVAWHLSESRRFFGELALPDDIADAAKLEVYLLEQCQREAGSSVPKNHVRQCGPGRLRSGKRLDAALKVLSDLDRIRLMTGRPVLVEINPALLGGRA